MSKPEMPSEEDIDFQTNRIMDFIYGIGFLNTNYTALPIPMQRERDRIFMELHKVVKEILEQDACELHKLTERILEQRGKE